MQLQILSVLSVISKRLSLVPLIKVLLELFINIYLPSRLIRPKRAFTIETACEL